MSNNMSTTSSIPSHVSNAILTGTKLITQVKVYDGAALIGTTTSDPNGNWTLAVSSLGVGSHNLTATVSGGVPASNTWAFTVKAPIDPITIDTSNLVLNAALVRYGRAPTHPPTGTSATRSASGGTPPYRYTTSSNAVNIDESTGEVISWRNGSAVITVTDSVGETAQYSVTVSNVLELDGYNGRNTYDVCTRNASNYGGRIPTLAEFQALRAAYGGSPKLPEVEANPQAWTTTSAGGKLYYTISPNTGASGSQPDQGFIIGERGSAFGWAIVVRGVS